MSPSRFLRLSAVILCLLWTAALFFPSLGTCRDGGVTWFDNTTVVLFGWLGGLTGLLGWYANIPFGFALVFLGAGHRPPLWIGLLGLALAMTSFLPVDLAHNEAWSEPLCAWGAGFWLWFAIHPAILLLGIAGRLSRRLARA